MGKLPILSVVILFVQSLFAQPGLIEPRLIKQVGATTNQALVWNGTIWAPAGVVNSIAVGTSGTDFAVSASTGAITINLPTASATNRGALSAADWSTFNAKQAPISVTSPITLSGASIGIVNQGTNTQVLHGNAVGNAAFSSIVKSDLPATVVHTDQANTFGAFVQTHQAGVNFILTDTTDLTKKIKFDLSAITTATTRTISVPDADSTFAQPKAAEATKFLTTMSATGVFSNAQPNFTDIAGTVADAQLANTGVVAAAYTYASFTVDAKGRITVASSNTPVTSVSGTAPIVSSGGQTPAISCATCVTSAAALTANQLVIGAGLQASQVLGSLGTTTTVLHGNAAGAPTFGAVSLSADVTGNLPVANLNGGTSASSSTFWRGDATWSNVFTLGTGSVFSIPQWFEYVAGVCQNVTASIGFSLPTANAPTAACVTGTNSQIGVAQFTATGQTAQGRFILPTDWVSGTGNDLEFRFKSVTATSGNVVWSLQTACFANTGATVDPSWNTAQTVSVTAQGVANTSNIATISTITTTGCSAGNVMLYVIGLDGTTTATGNEDLLSIRFKVKRTLTTL